MEEKKRFEVTSVALHIMAMAFMLCDHLWATIVSGNEWLTCVGRLAFPIVAFMIAEGWHYTASRKRYVKRMLIFALISEIPFDLMVSGSIFYPLHQNVMFAFLLSMGLLWLNDEAKRRAEWWPGGGLWLRVIVALSTVMLGYLLGIVLDYGILGIMCCMGIEWAVKTLVYGLRFRGDKWLSKKTID